MVLLLLPPVLPPPRLQRVGVIGASIGRPKLLLFVFIDLRGLRGLTVALTVTALLRGLRGGLTALLFTKFERDRRVVPLSSGCR